MRIALVTEIPAPFRIPLFNALAERPGVGTQHVPVELEAPVIDPHGVVHAKGNSR